MGGEIFQSIVIVFVLGLAACSPTFGPAATQAKIAFDSGQWERAAIDAAAIVERPTASAQDRQAAELWVGVSFFRLGLRAAGASIVKNIADTEDHTARTDALRSLPSLAADLPEAAATTAPLLRLDEATRASILEELPPSEAARIFYQVLREASENKDCARSALALEKLKGTDRARGLLHLGMCHVRTRKSVPAAKAFDDALQIVSEPSTEEARHLTDLLHINLGRLFYSAAISSSDQQRFVVYRSKLNTALKYWNRIDITSPLATEAQWERAWAHLALGDPKRALSDARAASLTPGVFVPEAALLVASVRWGLGENDAALKDFRAFVTAYSAVRDGLAAITAGVNGGAHGEESAFALAMHANHHPEEIPEGIRLAVVHALADKRMRDALTYGALLDEELRRVPTMKSLHASAAGARALRALDQERRELRQWIGGEVRGRLAEETESLNAHLRKANEALSAVTP